LPAKDVNDDAFQQEKRGVFESFAGKPAPTGIGDDTVNNEMVTHAAAPQQRICPPSHPQLFLALKSYSGGVRGGINRLDPIDSNAEAKRSSVESS
jgi:hypothetical protein